MLNADNVFPEPDSPTIAAVFPLTTSIFTLFTTLFLLKEISKF